MKTQWLVMLTLAVALILPLARAEDGGKKGQGFAGMIAGTVVSKAEGSAVVEVTAIEKAWKHSRMENPQSLVGQKVTVKPGAKGNTGSYLKLLNPGDKDVFDVRQDGAIFVWLELTKDQRAKVGADKKDR